VTQRALPLVAGEARCASQSGAARVRYAPAAGAGCPGASAAEAPAEFPADEALVLDERRAVEQAAAQELPAASPEAPADSSDAPVPACSAEC